MPKTPRGNVDHLAEQFYAELRRVAAKRLSGEKRCVSLQPTLIANEAYMKLARLNRLTPRNKGHFLALAAKQIEFLLIDHARHHRIVLERLGHPVTLEEDMALAPDGIVDVLALHEALDHLDKLHPRQAEVARLRYFGGLNVEEVAAEVGVSVRTIKGDWKVARAWLRRELLRIAGEQR